VEELRLRRQLGPKHQGEDTILLLLILLLVLLLPVFPLPLPLPLLLALLAFLLLSECVLL
jgi:hypothetical protein